MKDSAITVSVKIDARLFRNFAIYDAFRMKKRWKSPVLFALILLGFAILCFSRAKTQEQAVFMGAVLLAVGFGLPIIYFANFFRSINVQIRKLGLKSPQPVYTVTLTDVPDGIHVAAKNGETAQYEWNNLYGVHQGKSCTYLYVQNNRAYLLPDRDIGSQAEALGSLLEKRLLR